MGRMLVMQGFIPATVYARASSASAWPRSDDRPAEIAGGSWARRAVVDSGWAASRPEMSANARPGSLRLAGFRRLPLVESLHQRAVLRQNLVMPGYFQHGEPRIPVVHLFGDSPRPFRTYRPVLRVAKRHGFHPLCWPFDGQSVPLGCNWTRPVATKIVVA